MIFNSLSFFFFLLLVLTLYWAMQPFKWRLRGQNTLLLIVSYYFYGSWDWVFLGLVIFSTLLNYTLSLLIDQSNNEKTRKGYLILSLIGNFGLLGFFKYYNFFAGELMRLLISIGTTPSDGNTLLIKNLILPVGISFFTFQASAYTIDVFRRRIPAERNLADFSLFVVYFPQLVAGPIERAEDLLSALKKERTLGVSDIPIALWNILHGFFLKVVVADNLAPLVDGFFGNRAAYLGASNFVSEFGAGQVLVTGIAFMVQIYGDFAGYSFIALGSSQLLGIQLTRNFLQPFFSTNPTDFWRRWHTTLIRWFMDYVYVPLGGSRVSKWMHMRNIMAVYLVSGLWHGANWTYIIWGGIGGASVIGYRLIQNRTQSVKSLPLSAAGFVINITLVAFGALIFRAYDITQALSFFKGALLSWDKTGLVNSRYELIQYAPQVLQIILPVFVLDGLSRFYKSDDWLSQRALWIQVLVPLLLFFTIIFHGRFGKEVIYFAF